MNISTILTNYLLIFILGNRAGTTVPAREPQFPLGNHQYNLKKGVGVPVELKMAPGLKVGNRVKANATSIFGSDEREVHLDLEA